MFLRKFIVGTIKDWYANNMTVSYVTALRYEVFARIVKNYPRLMICGLDYYQIVKHKDALLTYLKTDNALAQQLKLPVHFNIWKMPIDITPANVLVPDVKLLKPDPDMVYYEEAIGNSDDSTYDIDMYDELIPAVVDEECTLESTIRNMAIVE